MSLLNHNKVKARSEPANGFHHSNFENRYFVNISEETDCLMYVEISEMLPKKKFE
jgi:hypothetical protein